MSEQSNADTVRLEERVALFRRRRPEAERWAGGYGAIRHSTETQARVFALSELLEARGTRGDGVALFELLRAADRVASAAMWLVVHQTYARRVYLDGRDLGAEDFKPDPEGHTGGSLNMVPAYVGYMTANTITGQTRSWLMGQGHCVAAIDAVNVLLDNMTSAHAERYSVSDEGLTRYVQDFYAYTLDDQGRQESPLGSHVNAHTAGGMVEGGYLGFSELQYVHMPLPGEQLVVFLSDGAFEEQRGSDWAPRWWRAGDCGLVTPIMIHNGRRIDQETTLSQQGGIDWFQDHLRLNSFDPVVFDGRDPAAFAWAILDMEDRLQAAGEAVRRRRDGYPVRLPYGIAHAPKGAGFFNEGTNLAHNLPLPANPHVDPSSAEIFNRSARTIWVPEIELRDSIGTMQSHAGSGRAKERDHKLAHRDVQPPDMPEAHEVDVPGDRRDPASWARSSPMRALDRAFLDIVHTNPRLRARVGNPDEMRSNRMQGTLDALKFRVTDPKVDVPESVDGGVITALNEEAVASAALANKGGINIIVTYEAFGAKMHGAVRQEITFAAQCLEAGRPQRWLSIPLVLTSHAWENGKNEYSHQDPSMAETMLGEQSHVSRVLFPADHNTAVATLRACYQSHGQVWTLVIPKSESIPQLFTPEEARRLLEDGALRLDWAGHEPERARVVLTAVGGYQLEQALRASARLAERQVEHSVVYMIEPGRYRRPRSDAEAAHAASESVRARLYPSEVGGRLFLTHTRPETLLGTLRPLCTERTEALGYIVRGGTLDAPGMLFVNRCTWAHAVDNVARLLDAPREELLLADEIAALDHARTPEGAVI